MYGKTFFLLVLVILGAVLPYLLADEQWLADAEAWFTNMRATMAADTEAVETTTSQESLATKTQTSLAGSDEVPATMYGTLPAGLSGSELKQAPTTVQSPEAATAAGRNLELPRVIGPPGIPLEHLLSFNVTPKWISANWQRVTTQVAELDLHGWRVPIALGSGNRALAGSTTYYFDAHRELQRILLHGYSADPSELIRLAQTRFRMRRIPSALDDLYSATADGQTIGAMRIRHSPIAKNSAPKRCEVLMELNRQGTRYGMSKEFSQLLKKSAHDLQHLSPTS